MDPQLWTAVDHYIVDRLIPADPVLDESLRANAAAGLPAIDVAPNQGKLLYLLARIQGAKRILELGTLGGYSTIWLARALPSDGKLITLEVDANHAQVASKNIKGAGLSAVVEVRVGPALQSLAELHAQDPAPFDLIFIDADKSNYPSYLEWCLRFARVGTVIIGDNVVRNGAVIDPHTNDPSVQGVRTFFDLLSSERRLDVTALQTVGTKGYDGFVLAVVTGEN